MGSFLVPMVMLAIPLTALGVMPGFYLLNAMASQTVGNYADPVYFTATAMIGMIALSGIVTRDSIILVDFMQQSVARGRPLFDAILEQSSRLPSSQSPTAGAALSPAIPITLDPIFSGLGWSLIFGLIASTLFTLFVIPVTYWFALRKVRESDCCIWLPVVPVFLVVKIIIKQVQNVSRVMPNDVSPRQTAIDGSASIATTDCCRRRQPKSVAFVERDECPLQKRWGWCWNRRRIDKSRSRRPVFEKPNALSAAKCLLIAIAFWLKKHPDKFPIQ